MCRGILQSATREKGRKAAVPNLHFFTLFYTILQYLSSRICVYDSNSQLKKKFYHAKPVQLSDNIMNKSGNNLDAIRYQFLKLHRVFTSHKLHKHFTSFALVPATFAASCILDSSFRNSCWNTSICNGICTLSFFVIHHFPTPFRIHCLVLLRTGAVIW